MSVVKCYTIHGGLGGSVAVLPRRQHGPLVVQPVQEAAVGEDDARCLPAPHVHLAQVRVRGRARGRVRGRVRDRVRDRDRDRVRLHTCTAYERALIVSHMAWSSRGWRPSACFSYPRQ